MKYMIAIARAFLLAVCLVGLGYFCSLVGCAARPPASDRMPREQGFWNGCQETIPANPDGFQHFHCLDYKNRPYEVLVRREGK